MVKAMMNNTSEASISTMPPPTPGVPGSKDCGDEKTDLRMTLEVAEVHRIEEEIDQEFLEIEVVAIPEVRRGRPSAAH